MGQKYVYLDTYQGPFKIIKRIGHVAYRLELPKKLCGIHNTFHVSNLKKCLVDENLVIPLEEIQLDDKLHFIEEPVEIMDREVKRVKQSCIPIVKVRWNSRRDPEFTWEKEDFFMRKYPNLFSSKKRGHGDNRAPGPRSRKEGRMGYACHKNDEISDFELGVVGGFRRIMPVTRQEANDAMTPESIQAMIDRAIQRNSTHTQEDASQNSGGGPRRPVQPARVCFYTDFMKCQPLNFRGTEGFFSLSRWVEKMELVFHISGCAVKNQVKFVACTMLDAALTWWNGHARTLGHDDAYVMTWETFKKRLTEKYCPIGEIKKLEIELWNLKVDKYISGLSNDIHENVMSARPKTLDFAIKLDNDLMDQKFRTYAERQAENKRKLDNNNQDQQQLLKKQNVVQIMR
nr:putative reverse transcriptase domain-containing protein [Tanacetum cinerariifolium]